jgi:TRAP-type mannitol/chloroaromatic compound transport system substrate-binding protein
LHLTTRHKLACAWPQSAGGTFDAALDIARVIEATLEGCSVEVVPDAPAMAEFSFGAEHVHASTNPALGFCAGLPGRFALPPPAAAAWLTGDGERLWQDASARTLRSLPLFAGCEGASPALWSARDIQNFAGLKVAGSAGLPAELLAAAGATSVGVPAAEYARALADRRIDAVYVASLEDALMLGLPRTAGHCLEGALAAHGGPLALRVAHDVWHSLPAGAQNRLRKQVAKSGTRRYTRVAGNHRALMNALREAHGLRTQRAGETLQGTLDRLSEAIVADFSSRDALCRTIGGASMAVLYANRKTAPWTGSSLNAV